MSENKTSQVQDTQAGWKKMMDDHVAGMELAYAEIARMQEQAFTQNKQAIEEMAKLSKESVDYVAQLSSEWRRLTLDATRQVVGLASFKG